ncbi:hypothetical protein ACFL27_28905 [candidate division CSSED10-310 bacterium]|uniref:Uncharacterized protein n=1 Tax=candidate division CSSED10-310 bacterium TaxID=2855610 RepID=A0ABV6Z722_UNCC1
MLDELDYYRDERVIRRMLEYCGVPPALTQHFSLGHDYHRYDKGSLLNDRSDLSTLTDAMSTEYLVGWGRYLVENRNYGFESVKNFSMGWLLDKGLDIFRSIWDRENTIGIIDVEYFSRKYPGLAYADPESTYAKLEPFHRCLMHTLFHFGFNPLVLATGQGYHYVFRIHNASPLAERLVQIGHVEASTKDKYLQRGGRRDRIVTLEEGKRFDAIGKLIEFLVHLTIHQRDHFGTWLPVTIGDIAVGNEAQEAINVDLSCYANPLFMRDIRLPFSTHQKHKLQARKVGQWVSSNIPIQIAIPRYTPCNGNELSLFELLHNRRHFLNSANYAGAITTEIPECSHGLWNLLQAYYASPLHQFHIHYDWAQQENPFYWPYTYDRFDLRMVPPCVAHILAHPNPALLQPTQIQTVVRTLCSKEWWHPKHVAGLIRSKYERNFGWEIDWTKYDANMWALGWTRFYAGMLADGTDHKEDFNCLSHQQKGIAWADRPFCVQPFCGYSLSAYSQ